MPKNTKKFLVYFAVLLIPFYFLFLKPKNFISFKMELVDIAALPMRIVLFPFEELKKVVLYHATYDRYKDLQKEVDILRGRLTGQEEIIAENKRLKTLLEMKLISKYPVVAAKVIGRDPSNWNSAMIIDKGEEYGLKQGMPVISFSSVIGKISETGRKTSKVLLLSDPAFSVAATLQRSRDSGLVTGTLQGICRIRYLPLHSDVHLGDKVITSSLSSSFPEGLLIGEIISIQENPNNPTIECLVKPAAPILQTEEVLVIKK